MWEVESGCALQDGNRLWTGVPTFNEPNRECSNGTGSAVFRMWTKRSDFDDVAVPFGLRNDGYLPTGESWDGVKIYLRRQDGDNFYTAEVNRREGNVIVQRKCDGRYALLGGARSAATPRASASGRTSAAPSSTCRTTRSASRSCARARSCSRRRIRPAPATRFDGLAGSGSAATGPSST